MDFSNITGHPYSRSLTVRNLVSRHEDIAAIQFQAYGTIADGILCDGSSQSGIDTNAAMDDILNSVIADNHLSTLIIDTHSDILDKVIL